jgi:hypothetical protein
MNTGITLICCIVFLFASTGCLEKDNTPEKWLGRYTYPEPANADNIIVSWEILINRLNGEYLSIINASSPAGNFSYSGNVSVNKGELFVVFEKSFSKPDPAFQKGDTLFSLIKESGSIKTRWKKLVPVSSINKPRECNCFVFRGLNENDNNISLP